jgi:hypothetical protein
MKSISRFLLSVCLVLGIWSFPTHSQELSNLKKLERGFEIRTGEADGLLVNIDQLGEINVEVSWQDPDTELTISLFAPYADQPVVTKTGKTPIRFATSVREAQLQQGISWRVAITGKDGAPVSGQVKVTSTKGSPQKGIVPLESGSILINEKTTKLFEETLGQPQVKRLRGFVRVQRIPRSSERAALAKDGIYFFEFLGNKTYRVTVEQGAALESGSAKNIVEGLSVIRPQDKVAPSIAWRQFSRFVAPPEPEAEPKPYVLNPDGTVNLTVIFAGDVSLEQATQVLQKMTKSFDPLGEQTWVIRIDPNRVGELAAEETVQWIDAAPAPALELNSTTRQVINVDPLQVIDMTGRPPTYDFAAGGDHDLLVATGDGQVLFFRNDGTDTVPLYITGVALQAAGVDLDVGDRAAITTGDRDDDADRELLVGNANGDVLLFTNTGTDAAPVYAAAVNVQAGGVNLNVAANASPFLWDADYDGDRDIVVGRGDGEVWLYLNTATDAAPVYAAGLAIQAGGLNVDVGDDAKPTYQDLDGDGDQDLVVGAADGQIQWFRNDGTNAVPNYVAGQFVEAGGMVLDVGEGAAPVFHDIDFDGDEDLIVGNGDGQVSIFANTGTNAAPVYAASSALMVDGVVLDVGTHAQPRFVDFDLDGVRIANAESGGPDWRHGDFEGRVVFRPAAAGFSAHSTHVMGTMAADGTRSDQINVLGNPNNGTSYQWRGMAPGAGIVFQSGITSNQSFFSAIETSGTDVINGSHVVSFFGVYSAGEVLRDSVVRGDAAWNSNPIDPGSLVYAAGNNGSLIQYGTLLDYFSMLNQSKNTIIVGNWNATVNPQTLSTRSSLGPAHDGRIKPDVVAPGTSVQSSGTGNNLDGYYPSSGTSMASPATAGVVALLLDAWQRAYNLHIDLIKPLPSTLRAILIQTAQDIDWVNNPPAGAANPTRMSVDGPVSFFPGPDFTSGWGLVNAQAGVAAIQAQQIIEGEVDQGDVINIPFTMPANGQVRVTLAWDDTAASAAIPATTSHLVNDLDLVLIDPAGNTIYPFSLNQQIVDPANPANVIPPANQVPGTDIQVNLLIIPQLDGAGNGVAVDYPAQNIPVAAAPMGRDHLNNVEQVVAAGQVGNWVAQVSGFNIPSGPQRFSLIGPWGNDVTPPQITCPTTFEIEATQPGGVPSGLLTVETMGVTATDLRDPLVDIAHNAPALLPVGDTVVTFTASDDAANTAACVVTVSVVDSTAPQLTCPAAPQTLECTSPAGAPSDNIVTDLGITAIDIVDGTPNITHNAPNPIPMSGPVLVTFTATDASTNVSTCPVVVTAIDNTSPSITCPASGMTFSADGQNGLSTASALWMDYVATAVAEDLCDASVVISTDAPNPIPLGQTIINFIATDASGNASASCAVTVEVVLPADISLVLDDTGSMQQSTGDDTGNSKIESLRGGVQVFTDILQQFRTGLGDRIGAMSFKVPPMGNGSLACQPEWTQQLVPMGALEATLPLIQPAVNGMPADGWWTPIRAGLETASNQLAAGEDGRRRVMLLLSDGKENTSNCSIGPDEEDIINFKNAFILHPDFQIRLLTVGFGAAGQIDADLLNTLATDGFYDSANSDQELDEWFVQSLADVLNQVMVVDPQGDLLPGQTATNEVPLTSWAKSATFIVTWARDEAVLDLSIRTPGGSLITAAMGSDPQSGVTALAGPTYKALILRFPLGGALAAEHAGQWTAHIHRAQNNQGADEPYSFMVMSDAPLRIRPEILRIPFLTGHIVPLQVKLPLSTIKQVKVTAQVFAPTIGLGTQLAALKLTEEEVLKRTPDLKTDASIRDRRFLLLKRQLGKKPMQITSQPIELHDDGKHQDGQAGDGIYGVELPLKFEGNYAVRYMVEGFTSKGEPFRREWKQGLHVDLDLAAGATDIRVTPSKTQGGVYQAILTPKDPQGLLLGPDYESMIKVNVEQGEVDLVKDRGDGSYEVNIHLPKNVRQANVTFSLGKIPLGTTLVAPATPSGISWWQVVLFLIIIVLVIILFKKKGNIY